MLCKVNLEKCPFLDLRYKILGVMIGGIGLKLLLAEKPSVAMELAKFFGASSRKDGYFEGNGYIVTFAYGHLLTLLDSKDYDSSMSKWELNKYPFIPNQFKYKVTDNDGAKKQFKTISSLVKRDDVKEIINCADSDREGELLSIMILQHTGTRKPIKRLWVSSYTPKDLTKGMNNLRDNSQMKNLQDSAFARQLTDWLIGINFTSTFTLKCGGKGNILYVGRVIVPTVKLIYNRDMEIKNFKPQDFYELKALFGSNKGDFHGLYFELDEDKVETKLSDKIKLENIANEVKGKQGVVVDKQKTQVKKNAPSLFNLNDLQAYITSKCQGFNAEKVLKVAQSLYEKKFITYPRTASRCLDDSQVNDMKEVLEVVLKQIRVKGKIAFVVNKRIFDSSKVDSHPAITPTYIPATGLSKDEEIVYKEIVLRFISQFMLPCEQEKTVIKTQVGNHFFITKGTVIVSEGWQELYGKEVEDDLLPDLHVNDRVTTKDTELLSKKTQPPKHYTEATLLEAMETCGKKVDDVVNILKGFSIGTPATRAETLKKIQVAGYVELKGKSFYVTSKGIGLIEKFPVKELMDVDYTGKLEKKLKDIELGKYSRQNFMNEIVEFIKKGVSDVVKSTGTVGGGTNGSGSSASGSGGQNKALGKCPECGKDVIETSKSYGCSGYSNGCKFAFWKDDKFLSRYKKKMTESVAKKLLKDKKIQMKDLVSPTKGTKFDCELELVKQDNGYWGLKMNFNGSGGSSANGSGKGGSSSGQASATGKTSTGEGSQVKAEVIGKCPDCGKDIVETGKAYSCSGYKEGCKFAIWKDDKFLNSMGKKMTKTIAKALVKNQMYPFKDLKSTRTGKVFSADVVLVKKGASWGYDLRFTS